MNAEYQLKWSEFKAKWVAALRSGEYKQAKGVLKDATGAMCCLGVAAELINPARWYKGPNGTSGWGMDSPTQIMHIAKELGITTSQARSLAKLNDGTCSGRRHSFAEIADYIEGNF